MAALWRVSLANARRLVPAGIVPVRTSVLTDRRRAEAWRAAPVVAAAAGFVLLFSEPMLTLARDWWTDPEAGHGLLLAPIAVYLAWRGGRVPGARAQPLLGLGLLAAAVLLRYVSGLAAELFTMRFSMLVAVAGLVAFRFGGRQLLHWWLPVLLLALSIPLPAVILGTLAHPLQFQASKIGAALLDARYVPVLLSGNIIHLPGRSLFVTEACSGLRSLTALLALGLLIAGLWLRSPWARALLVASTIPIAVALNGIRVFLTGFLVYFVNPDAGEGFMHYTEGWAIFVAAFLILGGLAWGLSRLEQWRRGSP